MLTGDFLPLQVIYSGKTSRCHPRFQFPQDWNITHSPNHWSNELTTIEYISEVIVPYVENVRDLIEENNIHVCLLPANTPDQLQPMDISMNKPAKDFLRRKFDDWYSSQISQQLEDDIETAQAQLEPVDLGLPILKAKWLTEMSQYISDDPLFIANGFIRAGITSVLGGIEPDDMSEDDNESAGSNSESETDTDDQLTDVEIDE